MEKKRTENWAPETQLTKQLLYKHGKPSPLSKQQQNDDLRTETELEWADDHSRGVAVNFWRLETGGWVACDRQGLKKMWHVMRFWILKPCGLGCVLWGEPDPVASESMTAAGGGRRKRWLWLETTVAGEDEQQQSTDREGSTCSDTNLRQDILWIILECEFWHPFLEFIWCWYLVIMWTHETFLVYLNSIHCFFNFLFIFIFYLLFC